MGARENGALGMDVESTSWLAVKDTEAIVRCCEWDIPYAWIK